VVKTPVNPLGSSTFLPFLTKRGESHLRQEYNSLSRKESYPGYSPRVRHLSHRCGGNNTVRRCWILEKQVKHRAIPYVIRHVRQPTPRCVWGRCAHCQPWWSLLRIVASSLVNKAHTLLTTRRRDVSFWHYWH